MSGLQARMSSNDNRLYNPGRDVAHNFTHIANLVAGRIEDEKWPELKGILDREGVTMDDLGEACAAYCTYIGYASDPEMSKLSMVDALKQSGWFDCKPAAQVGVMAVWGTCYAGLGYAGIREASLGGEGPMADAAELTKEAERLKRYIGMPKWRRKIADFNRRLRQAITAFRS